MVTGCEEFRALLADFVSARLAPEQSRLVDQHRQTCPDCGEIVADLETMKAQIQKSGEAMFEPHPAPAILHRYVLEGGGKGAAQIQRHLETCATCQLEVEAWKRIQPARAGARSPAPRPSLSWMSLAAGVGALLGLLAGWRFLSTAPPVGPGIPAPPATPPAAENPRPLVAPVIHTLPALMRSGDIPVKPLSLDRNEPYLNVAVPISVPADLPPSESFRFELQRPAGETVWRTEMDISRIREHIESAGVVSLAISPDRPLDPGRYIFRVVRAGTPEAPPIYQADVTIDFRQPPAETKAPQ